MRFLKLAVLVLFSYAATVSAQTVDEIIAKNVQAHGGMAKLKSIQSIRLTADFAMGGMQAGFTQVYKRPLKLRLDATVQQMILTQAYDGQNGWQVNPFTGKGAPEPMAGDDLKRIEEEADFDGPLLDYKQKGNTVQLIGKEKVDGADVYHLKVTLKSGDIRNLFIDAGSFLIVKTVGKTSVQGTEVELETKFSDFRDVQGVKLPFSILQQAADGQIPDQKITFQKVEVNVPVEDGFFKMPSASNAGAASTAQPASDAQKPPLN